MYATHNCTSNNTTRNIFGICKSNKGAYLNFIEISYIIM